MQKKIFQEIHHDTLHRTYHTLQIQHNLENLRRLGIYVTLITGIFRKFCNRKYLNWMGPRPCKYDIGYFLSISSHYLTQLFCLNTNNQYNPGLYSVCTHCTVSSYSDLSHRKSGRPAQHLTFLRLLQLWNKRDILGKTPSCH